jgi:hypothetical protein
MSELTKWLARTPRPAAVRVEKSDGETKTVTIGMSRSKWRDAESAIGDDAVRCEAVDEKGNVLRAWTAEALADHPPEKKKQVEGPEAMLVRFAELLTDACDKAVSRHAESINTAFVQLGELVKLYASRNAMLEKAWHKLLIDSAEAQAEAQPDTSDAVIGGIVQMGMAQLASGQQQAQPNGGGKAKGKG